MRQVGIAPSEPEANRFAAYLVTKDIAAHAEKEPDGWAIWVRDEDHFNLARDEYREFREDPNASRYQGAEQKAESIVREKVRQQAETQKNVVDVRGHWNRSATRKAPLTFTLIALCVMVTLFTDLGGSKKGKNALSFSSDAAQGNSSTFGDIENGELWRLITPIFMHAGVFHLLFNCYWLYILGTQIENSKGTLKYALIVLLAAVIPNVLQAVFRGPNFVGISGVVCGLFGYIWMKSVYAPREGMFINPTTVYIILGYLVLCMAPFFPGHDQIAHFAHFGGLAVGVALGYAPVLLKPMKKK